MGGKDKYVDPDIGFYMLKNLKDAVYMIKSKSIMKICGIIFGANLRLRKYCLE